MAGTTSKHCFTISFLLALLLKSHLCQSYLSSNEIRPFETDFDEAFITQNQYLNRNNQDELSLAAVKRNQDATSTLEESPLSPERNTPFPKRAPGGFLGTRGKKVLAEHIRAMMLNNNLNHNNLDEEDESDADEHGGDGEHMRRMPHGFMGFRGKKGIMLTEDQLQLLRHVIQQQREEYMHDMNGDGGAGTGATAHMLRLGGKRDPLKGFMGVRGKRPMERLGGWEMHDAADEQLKRAAGVVPAMGFVGMRGKKWTKPKTSAEETDSD